MWGHLGGVGKSSGFNTEGRNSSTDWQAFIAIRLAQLSREQYHSGGLLSEPSKRLSLKGGQEETLPNDFEGLGLEELDLSDSINISTVPYSVGLLPELKKLNLSGCTSLRVLPDSLTRLSNLQELNLSGCVHLQNVPHLNVPHFPGSFPNLKVLDLRGCTSLGALPDSIWKLSNLQIRKPSDPTDLQYLHTGFERFTL